MPPANRKPKAPDLPREIVAARRHLAIHGWQQVDAAEALDVSPVHLNYVLRNRRPSARLLARIMTLGAAPNPVW